MIAATLSEPWRSFSKDRTVKFTWDLGPGETPDSRKEAQLYVSHSTDSKKFFARLSNQETRDEGIFKVTTFDIFSGVTIAVEPVARYSAKRLDTFAESALQRVRELYGEDPKIASYFEVSA